MKTVEQISEELARPFEAADIEWRIGRAGKKKDGKIWAVALAYIDARAVMDRLDKVVGMTNWQDEYRREGDAYICRLSLKINGEWISKEDAADASDIEAVKGGMSGALKRAAVKWSVGRYLYNLTESFVEIVNYSGNGAKLGSLGERDNYEKFYWVPPKLPQWALPSEADTNKSVKESTEKNQEELKKEMGRRPKNMNFIELNTYERVLLEIEQAKTLDDLAEFWKSGTDLIKSVPVEHHPEIIRAKDKKKRELEDALKSSLPKV